MQRQTDRQTERKDTLNDGWEREREWSIGGNQNVKNQQEK